MLTDAIKLTQIVIGRYHFTGFCGHQLWYPLAHPTTQELFILIKFRNDCIEIVDFLIKAYFWVSLNWVEHVCTLLWGHP